MIKKDILQNWLEIEYMNTAIKAGFIEGDRWEVSYELLCTTIRFLDKETTKPDRIDKNCVISLIALMWENINHELYDIRAIIIRFLTRIGYSTSAFITEEGSDKERGAFSSINNVIDEIITSAIMSQNEIFIKEQSFLLTNFQMSIWKSLESEKNICISAPTSAGKSFVILLSIIKKLINRKLDVVYIVPTISLVNQVTEDFRKMINRFDISNCNIANFYKPEAALEKNIYILTQERAISAFSDNSVAFNRHTILVADEIQNIERIIDETDMRSKILYDVLSEFREKNTVIQTILSGPRIEKIGDVGKKIWGKTVNEYSTNESPVFNITYSVRKVGPHFYLKQYCNLVENPISHEITNMKLINGYGLKTYTNEYMESLNMLLCNIGVNNQNIVFAPTAKTARKIALSLVGLTNEEKELVDYYKETIHPQYSLCQTIPNGVAYHHGKLPMHVRSTLESAISEGRIRTVVCTTTLMQGINLPAQNIIIRNPHLYVKRTSNSAELSNYEMANLRGRAGRLMKEFIGRTFVLDESGFLEADGYEQQSLFDDTRKELPSSYEEVFDEYKKYIEGTVLSDYPVNEDMRAYGYLVTYIRQAVLRYGKAASSKMERVGIKLTQKQVAAIISKLNELSVPREVCVKNRYWDPFVLDYIYQNYTESLPGSIKERGAKTKINKAMKFLRDNEITAPVYEKYIPERYRAGRNRSWLINLSFQWANSVKLKDILDDKQYGDEDGADKIEETIEVLQNIVSYNLPLLLKPLFDMRRTENTVLSSLKSGTMNQIINEMIEMGIPRETALYLKDKFFNDDEKTDISSESIKAILYENMPKLSKWIQVQLRFLF